MKKRNSENKDKIDIFGLGFYSKNSLHLMQGLLYLIFIPGLFFFLEDARYLFKSPAAFGVADYLETTTHFVSIVFFAFGIAHLHKLIKQKKS